MKLFIEIINPDIVKQKIGSRTNVAFYKLCDELIERRPYRNTASQEQDITGMQSPRKVTCEKDDLTGRQP